MIPTHAALLLLTAKRQNIRGTSCACLVEHIDTHLRSTVADTLIRDGNGPISLFISVDELGVCLFRASSCTRRAVRNIVEA